MLSIGMGRETHGKLVSSMAKKGRSADLIKRRNAKVVARFVYWTEVQRLRTDDAIKHMAQNEFFLSECMIETIIKQAARENGDNRKIVFPHPKLPKVPPHDMELFKGDK